MKDEIKEITGRVAQRLRDKKLLTALLEVETERFLTSKIIEEEK